MNKSLVIAIFAVVACMFTTSQVYAQSLEVSDTPQNQTTESKSFITFKNDPFIYYDNKTNANVLIPSFDVFTPINLDANNLVGSTYTRVWNVEGVPVKVTMEVGDILKSAGVTEEQLTAGSGAISITISGTMSTFMNNGLVKFDGGQPLDADVKVVIGISASL